MEITDSDPLPEPLKNGSYWEPFTMTDARTGEVVPSRRLRPMWDKSWPDNESHWLLDVIHRIRKSGAEYTEHDFTSVTQIQFTRAIECVWKTLVKKWAAQNTTKQTQEERAALAKKKQRKMNVSHDAGHSG